MKGVTLKVARAAYSKAALDLAVLTFAARARAAVAAAPGGWTVTLAGKAPHDPALAGDFLNEILNQECRFLVSGLNATLASLQTTQALFAARGGENPPAPPVEDAAFRRETQALLESARKEKKA